jgi:hypothetical protein
MSTLAWAYAYVMPLLKVAAVVHAIRAGVAPFWFCVIVVVPFGELIYAATVLWPSGSVATRVVVKKERRSLAQLRYAFDQTPSLQNQVALADRLRAEGADAEAAALYAQALGRDAGFLRAHYGLAACQSAAGEHASALEQWRVVVDANRSYEEHSAWLGLIADLRALGRTEEALLELEKLVSASPQLQHVVEQCSALADAGRAGEARELLERALEDHEHAPRHVRRSSRDAFRRAKELASALAADR